MFSQATSDLHHPLLFLHPAGLNGGNPYLSAMKPSDMERVLTASLPIEAHCEESEPLHVIEISDK